MTLAGVVTHVRGGKAEGSPLVWRVSDITVHFGGVGRAARWLSYVNCVDNIDKFRLEWYTNV
jgi:hypothetical protein